MKAYGMTMRRRFRSKRILFSLGALAVIGLYYYISKHPSSVEQYKSRVEEYIPRSQAPVDKNVNEKVGAAQSSKDPVDPVPKTVPVDLEGAHPMLYLMTTAQQEFDALQKRQSKTLQEAVSEYKKRHGIPPPPNFDKWYDFARARDVQLIDEYDTIFDSITPFWGLKPSVIRGRAREMQGYDNVMISMLIRHGNVTKIDGGRDWMVEAVVAMVAGFTEWLPDMDIVINAHDEPRVIVPHEDLAKLVTKAKNVNMAALANAEVPLNQFSGRPSDMSDGSIIYEVLRTRFNSMQKQETWTQSRVSCPPESRARSDLDEDAEDDVESYAMNPLGFTHNVTAFSDICASPTLANSYGFFAGANVFNVVHELFPVFSQSKISSYQDILFPSPWYWADKVPYVENKDSEWRTKEDKLYWRGSTTGGYSRGGSWRRQHRQQMITTLTGTDQTRILQNKVPDIETPKWMPRNVPRTDFADAIDVAFTEVGQCDPGDCKAQKEFFKISKKTKPEEAWNYKFLLDMDGNAFSGRFYAFLKSKSLTFKMAVFREWHSEILMPWVHYIPWTLKGNEWLESIRYLLGEREGKLMAEKVARGSTEWANKALRKEDMEVYLFRLLLEYGRVVDDDREKLGYAFPAM